MYNTYNKIKGGEKYMANKLPENAKVGTEVTLERKVRGKKRKITYVRVPQHGKNKNLNWQIKKNRPR